MWYQGLFWNWRLWLLAFMVILICTICTILIVGKEKRRSIKKPSTSNIKRHKVHSTPFNSKSPLLQGLIFSQKSIKNPTFFLSYFPPNGFRYGGKIFLIFFLKELCAKFRYFVGKLDKFKFNFWNRGKRKTKSSQLVSWKAFAQLIVCRRIDGEGTECALSKPFSWTPHYLLTR